MSPFVIFVKASRVTRSPAAPWISVEPGISPRLVPSCVARNNLIGGAFDSLTGNVVRTSGVSHDVWAGRVSPSMFQLKMVRNQEVHPARSTS